ncbi:hypothetical protein FHX82_005183 [Amycolatopsis bartoniae]|nr:hypothetical protein [Amycolatopsis bartoniae]
MKIDKLWALMSDWLNAAHRRASRQPPAVRRTTSLRASE